MDKFKELPFLAQLGIIIGVFAMIAGGVYYFVLSPMYDANTQSLVKLKQIQAENAQLQPYRTRLADLERSIAMLQQQMEIQRQIVPDEKEVPEFIRMIQDVATESGVGLRRFESRPIARKEYYTEVPFGIEVDGPYYAVLNFFEHVSKLERIVNIDGLKVGGLRTKAKVNPEKASYAYPDKTTIAVACVAKTYFSNPQTALPPPPPGKR